MIFVNSHFIVKQNLPNTTHHLNLTRPCCYEVAAAKEKDVRKAAEKI